MPLSNFKPLAFLQGNARQMPALASVPALDLAPGPWVPVPYADLPRFDAADVLARWPQLHAGQALPPPDSATLLEGWALYHGGEFERAAAIGLQHGAEGATLANQATVVYANYLEPREATRLALFLQVALRASAQVESDPEDCHALFWEAYALGRYSQGISVARALAQGLGGKVKQALERVIAMEPRHADAHIALGAFHAEVIDKVGALVGRMTYGVRAETAIAMFERGVALNPGSASAWMEYGRGLMMLEGDAKLAEAMRLYEKAAAIVPTDARERLDAELAKSGNLG
jgi:tetratricopeptide (TPR) repeat protein